MDFENSTQRRRWTRTSFPQDDVDQPQPNDGNVDGSGESAKRQKQLVVRSCAHKIYQIGVMQKYPRNVVLTAMAYVRRYFKAESLENSDVSLMIVTALYLAGKVEEVPPAPGYELNQRGLDMESLCKCVSNKARSADMWKVDAIRNEMKLLVGLNFDLLCFHPLRSALGYVEETKRALNGNGAIWLTADEGKMLDTEIWNRCVACYLVDDLIFEYPPGFLGAVCVYSALKGMDKAELTERFLNVVETNISVGEAKLHFRERLKEASDRLEQGRMPEKEKDAAKAYNEYLKQRGRT